MYGTVAHLRIKPGQEQQAAQLMEEWKQARKPNVRGAREGYLFRSDADPQSLILVAVFEDRAAYEANAEDPEQDRWFRRFAELLEGEPEWHDGEIIATG